MARLSTYAIDGTPVSSDKLIGTDTAGTVTKNYPLGDVADWLKSSGATAVLGQNNYLFQIALDPDEGRKIGSFSFENYGGDGTAFEDVTNLKFSASSSAGKYIADYLLSTVDQKIMLSQLDDPNSFGIYVLASLVQSPLEPTFYDATLAVVSSNGVLRGNKSYGLATYSALNEAGGGTWGSITGTITNQTDLVDYIDAEIAAIPVPATPTLQSVTDAGAITTNNITTGSVTSNGNFLITGNDSTVQLRGSSVDFNIQTTAADNVARIATTTGGSARLELYNHIPGFNGALEFKATSWENDALVISGGTPNTTKFLVSRDPNAATLQVTGESYFTGNVGIGTTAPIRELHVYSSTPTVNPSVLIQQAGTGNASLGFSLLGSTEYNMGIDKADNNKFKIHRNYPVGGDGNVFTITGGNDVGIGTESPATKLHVATNNNNTSLALRVSNDHTAGRAGISFNLPNIFNEYYSVGVDNDRYFKISNGGSLSSNTRMVISPAGNVGIGTTAPNSLLHVARTSNGEVLRLQDTTNANQNYVFETEATGSFYGLNLKNSSTGDTIVNFSANGKLGIKTNNPDKALTINETADNDVQIKIGNHFGIGYSQAGQTRSVIGSTYGNDAAMMSFVLGGYTTASDKMTILGSGNVGIGTTAPLAKLHIKDGNTLTTALPNTSALIEGFSQSILQVASHSTGYSQLAFGDQDDGFDGGLIYSNASRYLAIEAANAEQMRFTSNGNVGIGTTAPAAKLHVSGELRLNAGQALMLDAANGIYAVAAQNQFRLYSGGNPAISITTAGRIGIGTTAPTEKLHITGGGAGNIRLDAGGTYYGTNIQAISSAGLKIGNDDFSGYAFFADDGNVGIGTTAPTEKLHVDGNIRTSFSTGIGVGTDTVYSNSVNINNSGQYRIGNAEFISKSANDMSIYQGRMWVQQAGNVGIGTTAPANKLHVNAGNVNQVATFESTDATAHITLKDNAGALYLNRGTGQSSIGSVIGDSTSNITIKDTGEVGIGTTAPSDKLEVNTGGVIGKGIKIAYDSSNYVTFSKTTSTNFDIKSFIGGSEYGTIHFGNSVNIKTTNGSGGINFSRGSSTLMKINNDGRVGIGTTAPTEKLEVAGNIRAYASTGTVTIGTEKDGNYARLNSDGTSGYISYGNVNGASRVLRFVGNSSEVARFDSSGNLGIGTTAPAHVLHINKDNPYIQIQDSSAPTRGDMSAGIIMKDSTGAQSFQITQSNSVDVSIRANAGDLSLGTFVGTVIKLDGSNVGVGTTAPNSKVHISGTAMQQLRMETAGGPSSSGDTSGRIGDMAYDDDFFYIKTANGWGRVQLDFGF